MSNRTYQIIEKPLLPHCSKGLLRQTLYQSVLGSEGGTPLSKGGKEDSNQKLADSESHCLQRRHEPLITYG